MEEKILDMIEEIAEDDIVKENLDINLFEEDILDSLGFTELIVEIEEKFGVQLSPTEIKREDIDTPNKIISIIKSRSK